MKAAVAVALVLAVSDARAQAASDEFGTTDLTVTTAHSSSFAPRVSTQAWLDDADAFRSAVGSPAPLAFAVFHGELALPSGAVFDRLELEACDTDAVGFIQAAVVQCAAFPQPGPCDSIGTANTGGPATPGCQRFSVALPNLTVNNNLWTYTLRVQDHDTTSATRFRSVRVFWRRQVSPAPATATFSDVPTSHFAFRFVEALSRAGITGGCASGLYCPDAPLTRAQMAVFLAAALGLHFPN